VTYSVTDDDEVSVSVLIDGSKLDEKSGREIDKKIKDSNLLFLYNSTAHQHDIYFGRHKMLYDFVFSSAEKKTLDAAAKYLETSTRRLARQHTAALAGR
jgi:hypothetical protein